MEPLKRQVVVPWWLAFNMFEPFGWMVFLSTKFFNVIKGKIVFKTLEFPRTERLVESYLFLESLVVSCELNS